MREYNKILQIIPSCLAFMNFYEFYDDKIENYDDKSGDFSVQTQNVEKKFAIKTKIKIK